MSEIVSSEPVLEKDVDVKSIEHLDVTPTCDSAGCMEAAAFGFHCRSACGTGGLLCEQHHHLYAAHNPWRKCLRCKVTARFLDLVILFPLGSA